MKKFALLIFITVVTAPSFSFAQVKEKKVSSLREPNAASRPKESFRLLIA